MRRYAQRPSTARQLALAVLCALLAGVFGAGCRPQETDVAPHDVRGEPLRKAPVTNQVSAIETATLPPTTNSATSAPAVAAAAPMPTPVEATDAKGKFLNVGFSILSGYNFELPDDMLAMPLGGNTNQPTAVSNQIPATVKALDNQRVAIAGFMLPLKVTGGYVTEMLIMKDQSMCCYGTVPKINEWVSVKMVGDGVKPVMDEPVTLVGTLHVGEMRENGYLVGIYSLDGERLETQP